LRIENRLGKIDRVLGIIRAIQQKNVGSNPKDDPEKIRNEYYYS